MSGLWFSNRGQMIQVTCAVVGLAVGIIVQWNQLSVAINFWEVLKVILYPAALLVGLQLGKQAVKPAMQPWSPGDTASVLPAASKTLGPGSPEITYQFLTPTVKVGSYFAVNEELGLQRVSILSIKTSKIRSGDVPVVEIEVTGTALDFSTGKQGELIHHRKALLPAYARSLKDADCSMFEFTYQANSFTFSAISVDHINAPSQEVNLVICTVRYRKRS